MNASSKFPVKVSIFIVLNGVRLEICMSFRIARTGGTYIRFVICVSQEKNKKLGVRRLVT